MFKTIVNRVITVTKGLNREEVIAVHHVGATIVATSIGIILANRAHKRLSQTPIIFVVTNYYKEAKHAKANK